MSKIAILLRVPQKCTKMCIQLAIQTNEFFFFFFDFLVEMIEMRKKYIKLTPSKVNSGFWPNLSTQGQEPIRPTAIGWSSL